MDNTIVVSSYGIIGTEMKELNRTSWIATAYVLFCPSYLNLSPFSNTGCYLDISSH